MNESTRNYIWWIAAIGFLIIPPLVVRASSSAGSIRIFCYRCLIIALTSLSLYLGLKKGPITANLPIGKHLKTDGSKKTAESFFRGLPLVIALIGFVMLVSIAPPAISYGTGSKLAIVETYTVSHINSAAMPGAFYIHIGIDTDDGKSLSFWYPNEVLQTGQRYTFTLLPDSDFVLSVQSVD